MLVTTLQTHPRLIGELNRFEVPGEGALHANRKWKNNRIGSDHAALKKLITSMRGLKSLSSAKATLRVIEAIRTIKHRHVQGKGPGVTGEIRFVESLFNLADEHHEFAQQADQINATGPLIQWVISVAGGAAISPSSSGSSVSNAVPAARWALPICAGCWKSNCFPNCEICAAAFRPTVCSFGRISLTVAA